MNVLVINCGSSSLKFSVVDTDSGDDLASGLFDRLGSTAPVARLKTSGSNNREERDLSAGASHGEALEALAGFLDTPANADLSIGAVGHRVVHGGEGFRSSSRLNEETIAAIEACNPLAPLHNPANLEGIRRALAYFPALPQVAVFDTAFHHTLEPESYLYPIPMELYHSHGIRRYGFHGTSHMFVCQEASRILGLPLERLRLITAHLGNGCSATAVQGGRSVDTTMGLTPLEGLVMGTRSGSIDPGIIFHLARSLGMDIQAIETLLNKRSGLLGLSGHSNDMRAVRERADEGNEAAKMAIRIFANRLAKALASLRCSLDGLDALVFTGGIGENDDRVRAEAVQRLSWLGLELDAGANQDGGRGQGGIVSTEASSARVLVIPTNEELMIARETQQTLNQNTSTQS